MASSEGEDLCFENEPRNLRKCLEMLKNSKSDNEKFAALLMVTKAVRASQCGTQDRKAIIDAMGFPFLTRLMKTKNVPEGCPSSIYRSLAVSILSSLCEDPYVACVPEMKKLVPYLNEIILAEPKDSDDAEVLKQTQMDCFSVLYKMGATPVGCDYLIEGGCPRALVGVIVNTSSDVESKAMGVLLLMLRQKRQATWTGCQPALQQLLAHLSTQVNTRQDASKFSMCDILAFILAMSPSQKYSECRQRWVKPLMATVALLVKSKLGEGQRQSVLMMVSSLVQFMGVTCLLPPVAPEPKLLQLVAHLAAIEVRMATENCSAQQLRRLKGKLLSYYNLLENIMFFILDASEEELPGSQVKVIHSAMLSALKGVTYLLSEVSYGYMKLKLHDPIVLGSIRMLGAWMAEETTALQDEVVDLLPFLIGVCKIEVGLLTEDSTLTMVEERKSTSLQGQGEGSPQSCKKGLAAITYPGECHVPGPGAETGGEQTCTMDVCLPNNRTDATRSPAAPGEAATETVTANDDDGAVGGDGEPMAVDDEGVGVRGDTNVKDKAVTGMAKDFENLLSVQDDLGAGSQNFGSDSASVDVMKYLMPGFLHITVDDEARDLMVNCGLHQALLMHFMNLHGQLTANPSSEDFQGRMSTLCNVLLNFAVTDKSLCSVDPVFQDLVERVIQILPTLGVTITLTIPKLPRPGVLCAVYRQELLLYSCHLTVLGLMLTRVQAPHYRTESENRKKFFSACITFLSRGLEVQMRHNKAVGVKISDDYKTEWPQMHDLWVISVQEVTAILAQFPDLVETILKSAWIPTLCKILIDAGAKGLDPDMKPVLLALIYKLATVDDKARTLITELRGVEMAKSHGMLDLEQVLKGEQT